MKSKERILIILAGGASSRLKKSLNDVNLDQNIFDIAKRTHKTLIPLGDDKRPLLYFILQNALIAGVRDVFLITSSKGYSSIAGTLLSFWQEYIGALLFCKNSMLKT